MEVRIYTHAAFGCHYPYTATMNAISFLGGKLHPMPVDRSWLYLNVEGGWCLAFDMDRGGVIAFENQTDEMMWRVRG